MTHSIYNSELKNELLIDETISENTAIFIIEHDSDEKEQLSFYLTPKQLHDFIGTLLHVQSKKRTTKNG